jgi:hypothetical protein
LCRRCSPKPERGNVLTESMFGVSLTSSDVTYQ